MVPFSIIIRAWLLQPFYSEKKFLRGYDGGECYVTAQCHITKFHSVSLHSNNKIISEPPLILNKINTFKLHLYNMKLSIISSFIYKPGYILKVNL